MVYKTPQKHNSAIKTTLTNGIRKLLARRKYSSVKPLVLKEALEYHQKINDIEIKRIFCEDLAKMQKVLPVTTMDKGSMLKVKKVLSKYGFALMHMSDDIYLSTTLMHKAGFSMSTKIKLGVTNAKRVNIINMLNLSVNMDETPDNKETDMELDITLSLRWNFIDDVKKAVENGEGIKYESGNPIDTLENRYERMVHLKKVTGAPSWDECIKAYDNAFYYPHTGEDSYKDADTIINEGVTAFLEALKYAVENGEGKDYKWGETEVTLEAGYKNMLQVKQDGSDVWDECIEEYEYAFYESVFIDAIKKALKDGNGIKHKFGHYEQTLESYYMTILIEKAKGSKEYDGCIEAYEEAFFESIFMNAVKQAIDNGEGVKYKFGFDNRTLEQWHNSMLIDKGHGAVKWDSYITAYDDAFNCKSSHYGDKVEDDEDKGSPVTTLPKTDTKDKKKDDGGDSGLDDDLDTQFIDAVKYSKKHGKGRKYKFGNPLVTLEEMCSRMRELQAYGAKKWDDCIEAYNEAFYKEEFLEAVNKAVELAKGIKHRFGEDLATLESAYNKMLDRQLKGSKEWDICIKAYEDAFEEDIAKAKAEEEAIAKAIAADKKKAKAKAAKAKAIKDKEDAEERATINALIDKVERLWKSGKYKYAEHDTYEPPETFEYRTGRQGLISFYKEMLKEQAAGSDKWNPCIQKYQDTFTEHAFMNLIKNGKGIDQKFGTKQNRIEDVYKGMLTVQANDEDEWDDCIETYSKTFFNTAFIYAIKRAKMTGMGIKYMWVKNKFTLEQMYKQMLEKQVKGDKKFDKYIQAYEHSFGYDKNLIK